MTFPRRSSREAWPRGWRLLLLALTLLPAGAEPMVIFLKNGDRLSGEIASQSERRVVLKSAVTGRITIPRDQIERMISAADLATASAPAVTNAPAATPASTPAPAPAASPPVAATPTAGAPAPPSLTNAPPVTEPWIPGWFSGAWTNWHGSVQFGANLGFGTTDRHAVFANASAAKKWGRTTSLLNYSLNYGVANDVENANRMAGDTKVDIELNESRKIYTYGLGGAGYDVIRQVHLEYIVGGGMGYKFIDRPKLVVAGELGAQYQAYDYDNAPDKDNIAGRIGENLTTQLGKNVTLTQRFGFTPALEELSDYQIRFGVTLSCPLFKPLTLNLNLTEEYDSLPAPGVSNNDLQVSTTIGVNF